MATIEDYICEHLARPLRLKDGSQVLNDDGKPVTKEEGIAMNVVNQALQGDIKAMMQMLVSDISNAVEHWSSRIIVNSHNK